MYSVTYELAHGRPYSKLEELLLKAVNDFDGPAGCTFSDLGKIFLVHERLLTEGLVTLIQEGWVAMVQQGNEVHYLITKEGRLTIESGRRPSNLRVHTRHAKIVRERLTGQLARSSDLQLVTGPNAVRASGSRSWKKHQLTPRMQRTKINGGETEHLLPRSRTRQEWIRWIDSVARLNTDLYYLPVLVDPERDEVMGLPHQWRSLKPLVLEEVTERYEEFAEDAGFQEKPNEVVQAAAAMNEQRSSHSATAPPVDNTFAEASIRCADYALTGDEGRQLAEQVLAECSGNVLIVAARLDVQKASAARELLTSLRRRGVNADLLWSSAQVEGAAEAEAEAKPIVAVDEINHLLGAARGGPGSGKVVFNRTPSPAATDLVLATTERGPVAVMGADVLCASAERSRLSPAVRFSDPAALASVARLCAGWWEEIPGDEGTLPSHRWKHLAERWAGEAALSLDLDPGKSPVPSHDCPEGQCVSTVSLLIGLQSADLREELAAGQGRRFLVADSGCTREALAVKITENTPAQATGLYRAVGGVDGWQLLEWTAGAWKLTEVAWLAKSPERGRVTASDDRWLVEDRAEDAPALSFSVSGHAAVRAWQRICSVR
ncbi:MULTISPECIES: hypothetical protein [Streptomyces]|uniref:hypothetical protein n=1 Tax=Streptomyces TaxID=1883 RepID=UPI00115FBFCC|nr:hypothetical protein [Streptomyces sp. PAN_FS17]